MITDLREPPKASKSRESTAPKSHDFGDERHDPQPLIDQLNRDFGNLREVLSGADAALSESLLDPVLTHFANTLEAVVTERPDLDPKSEALIAMLNQFLEPPASELSESFPDDDLPF